jgi:hypothetical protein
MDGKHVFKSWRENGEKKFLMEAFRPYFYVKEDEKEHVNYSPSKYIRRNFELSRS